MTHRLYRSLVVSSVIAFEGGGCTSSHDPTPEPSSPPADDGGGPRPPADAGRADAGSRRAEDAGTPVSPDTGIPARSDAGVLPWEDLRLCEPGWPTTKGFVCHTLEDPLIVVCCRDWVGSDGGLWGVEDPESSDCCAMEGDR